MATFERVLFHQSTSGFPDGFRAFGGRFWWPQKAATKILGLGFVDSLLGSLVLGWAPRFWGWASCPAQRAAACNKSVHQDLKTGLRSFVVGLYDFGLGFAVLGLGFVAGANTQKA